MTDVQMDFKYKTNLHYSYSSLTLTTDGRAFLNGHVVRLIVGWWR